MKLWTACFLMTTSVWAGLTVSLENPLPGKPERVEVQQADNGQWSVVKGTNAYNPADNRLGKLAISDKSAADKLGEEIKVIQTEIEETESLLSSKNAQTAPITAPQKTSHEPYVVINGRSFNSKTPYYNRVSKIVKDYLVLPMTLQNGVQLDEKKENYVFMKDGKKSSQQLFVPSVHCRGVKDNLRCIVQDWGVLYLN